MDSRGDKTGMKTINTVICSLVMSSVLVSAIFLSEIISISADLWILPYFLAVVSVYSAMLLSENKKILLIKWGISLPLCYLCLNYFWRTNYSTRALNWLIDGYGGNSSAGGGFAGFVRLVFLLCLCLAGIMLAFSKSSDKMVKYTKLQLVSGIVIFILNASVVVYLEKLFPPYKEIMS